MCDFFPFHELNWKKVVKREKKKQQQKMCLLIFILFVSFLLLLRVNRKPTKVTSRKVNNKEREKKARKK